jgi:hypothetical protein
MMLAPLLIHNHCYDPGLDVSEWSDIEYDSSHIAWIININAAAPAITAAAELLGTDSQTKDYSNDTDKHQIRRFLVYTCITTASIAFVMTIRFLARKTRDQGTRLVEDDVWSPYKQRLKDCCNGLMDALTSCKHWCCSTCCPCHDNDSR